MNDYEVVVVNNSNPQSLTKNVSQLIETTLNFSLIHKNTPGLSGARNKGMLSAKAPWVGFVDDDTKCPPDFIHRALTVIESENFYCFGGHIESFWRVSKPKWLPAHFGTKPILKKQLSELEDDYIWGSNLFADKDLLLKLGGFPEDLGMKGNILGYGADNYIQDVLRDRGYKVGYDPDLVVYHKVALRKTSLNWHLFNSYYQGRDGKRYFAPDYTLMGILRSFKQAITSPITSCYKFFINKEYYWQNLYIDSFAPLFRLAGKFRAISK